MDTLYEIDPGNSHGKLVASYNMYEYDIYPQSCQITQYWILFWGKIEETP